MSKIALEGNASGTGTFTVAAPNSNSNYTLTLPTSTGTVVVTGGAQTIEFAAGTVSAPSITTTGDTNTGIFFPAADTIAFTEGGVESMRITSAGRVGINLTAPVSVFEVSAAATGTTPNAVKEYTSYIHNANVGANAGELAGWGVRYGTISSTPVWFGARFLKNGVNAASDFGIFTSSDGDVTNLTERLTVTSSGNVGIGTTSPGAKLDVTSTSAGANTNALVLANLSSTANTATSLILGPATTPTTRNATIRAINDGSNQISLAFLTSAADAPAERARITSGGNLLVGSTADNGRITIEAGNDECIWAKNTWGANGATVVIWNSTSSGDNIFQDMYVNTPGASLAGRIDFNRSAGLTRYNTSSDATLKNILGDSDGQKSIDILNSTRIREFAWKDDQTQKPQIGVIAQELYETYKGAVSVGGDYEVTVPAVTEQRLVSEAVLDENGNEIDAAVYETVEVEAERTETKYRPWGVDKTAFTFHLIAGWQAHEKMITELKAELDTVKAELATLKGTPNA